MSDSFNIIVGDPGGDGHGHTDTQLISTAMTHSDVENAWQAVNDKLDQKYGFNLYDLCQEYEDCLLTKEQSDALIDAGVPLSSIVDPAYAYLEVVTQNLRSVAIVLSTWFCGCLTIMNHFWHCRGRHQAVAKICISVATVCLSIKR
jgi:hypothetical protein